MNDKYRVEVNTESGGYSFSADTLSQLLVDVEMEFGRKEVERVSKWAESSKEGDKYVCEDGQIHIENMGNRTGKRNKMDIIEENAKTIKKWLEHLGFEHEHPGFGKDVYKKLDEIIEETRRTK